MHIALSPADRAFQEDVRAFLDAALTPDLREASKKQAGVFAEPALARRWHKILYEKGWIAPAWPKEYGGPGWGVVQRYLFAEACAQAGAPVLPALGLQMCGPVLMRFGTPAQKEYFLPRILSGEHYWCQGYSEPQAGSDLASLKCKAVREGDEYVVTGSKIWTTHAHAADWIFLLVRTSGEGKPQAGITFLLADMKSPGLSVQPIISMSGEHEVNQVFFDGVRIPASQRVGEENQGWTVAKYLLEFERGGGTFAARVRGLMNLAQRIARENGTWDDEAFQRRYCEAECALNAVDFTERRIVSQMSLGQNAGDAAASMMKLAGSEAQQRATELAVEALGVYAAPSQAGALYAGTNEPVIGGPDALTVVARYLNARAATIYGGSSEIQRTILAKAALGL